MRQCPLQRHIQPDKTTARCANWRRGLKYDPSSLSWTLDICTAIPPSAADSNFFKYSSYLVYPLLPYYILNDALIFACSPFDFPSSSNAFTTTILILVTTTPIIACRLHTEERRQETMHSKSLLLSHHHLECAQAPTARSFLKGHLCTLPPLPDSKAAMLNVPPHRPWLAGQASGPASSTPPAARLKCPVSVPTRFRNSLRSPP